MRNLSILLIIISFFNSCKTEKKNLIEKEIGIKTEVIKNENYELIKPINKSNAVLFLFGGYPERISDIKREFKIIDIAKENGIAILFLNFNEKLWLEEDEKSDLATLLQNAIIDNELPINNIHFGGFSSGGNISLLISDFIIGKKQFYIDPKGVFIIDSPIDFLAMYEACKRILKRGEESGPMQQQSAYFIKTFEDQFGNPADSISKFEEYSVYTSKTQSIKNIRHLKNTKIRFYTEPDTLWWKKFDTNYEDMNAYNIKHLSQVLKKEFGFQKVEYIQTENKGYRSDGQKFPHSWSIVDKKELSNWILNKK